MAPRAGAEEAHRAQADQVEPRLEVAHPEPARYLASYAACYWCTLLAGWLLAARPGYVDHEKYVALAAGRPEGVPEPFASRVLGPFLAGGIADVTGISARHALAAVGAVAWAACALPAAAILRRARVPLPWALVIATVPFPALAVGYHLVPDGVAALLVLTCLWAIDRGIPWVGGAGAALAVLARNTSLAAIGTWSAVRARAPTRRPAALAALAGIVVGLAAAALVAPSAANVHGMSGPLYYVTKPVANTAKNVFGLELYVDSIDWCEPPAAAVDVSFVPGHGRIDEVGYCSVDVFQPLYSLLCYALIFGVMPFLVGRAVLRRMREAKHRTLLGRARAATVFAPFTVVFLLSPTFGVTVERLFVEAYPLLFPIAALVVPRAGEERLKPTWPLAYNVVGFAVLAAVRP